MFGDCGGLLRCLSCFSSGGDGRGEPDPGLGPVLLVTGMGGSILNAKKKTVFGIEYQLRVWVRILFSDLEFRSNLWSKYNQHTGYVESLDPNVEIVVPQDDHGLYALDILDPSLDALTAIKGGRVPPPGSLPSFEEIKDTLGFNDYYEEEKRYSISAAELSPRKGYSVANSSTFNPSPTSRDEAEQKSDPIVEVLTPYGYKNFKSDDSKNRMSGIWSRTLRLKITGKDGQEKLDVRVPAGFLEGMANVIPGLMGVNIMELLEEASAEVVDGAERGKLLLDFNGTMGDKIQVFVE